MNANPYERFGAWYFHDELGDEYGPFKTEAKAEKELKAYAKWLEHGPTLWQRVWWPIKGFFR